MSGCPWKCVLVGQIGLPRAGRVMSYHVSVLGTRGYAKNAKSLPPMCLLQFCVACLLDAPSCLCLGRAPMKSPNFIWVVYPWKPQVSFRWVRLCRVCVCPCKCARVGWIRLGCVTWRHPGHTCHIKNAKLWLSVGLVHNCVPIFLTLHCSFVSVVCGYPCKLI